MADTINYNEIKSLLKSAKDYTVKDNIEQAIACYERVTQLEPNHVFSYLQLGKFYKNTNRIIDSILAFQKAIEIKSEQPFWVYEALGNALSYQNRFNEAIVAYEKAMSINSELPSRIYRNIAYAFEKEKKNQQAIHSYTSAIEKNTNNNGYLNLRISHVYSQLNQSNQAIINYKKWIEKYYLINHRLKVIYCPIPKNACTFFKIFMIENSPFQKQYIQFGKKIHQFISQTRSELSLQDFSNLENQEYFNFTVLRNPFDRLVSAYLNKFVQAHPNSSDFAQHVIKDVQISLGRNPDMKRSINFSQFIHYLASNDNAWLEYHWYPQHLFLGLDLIKFDYIGQFERMDLVCQQLEKKLGIKINSNNRKHGPVNTYTHIENEEKLHEKYPEELLCFNGFPRASQLYTPELEELVRIKYAKDIEIYESEFNVRI